MGIDSGAVGFKAVMVLLVGKAVALVVSVTVLSVVGEVRVYGCGIVFHGFVVVLVVNECVLSVVDKVKGYYMAVVEFIVIVVDSIFGVVGGRGSCGVGCVCVVL